MDPNATLELIAQYLDSGELDSACEACEDLREWIHKGGFEPDFWKYPIAHRQYMKHCKEGCKA